MIPSFSGASWNWSGVERYQRLSEYARIEQSGDFGSSRNFHYQRIGFAYANLGKFETAVPFLEKALEGEFDDQIAYELARPCVWPEEFQKPWSTTNKLIPCRLILRAMSMVMRFTVWKWPWKALEIAKRGPEGAFDAQLKLFASQLSYELL